MKENIEKPIRILQVVNIMDRAGIESMLMNYYRNIDRNKIQFDFLTHRENEGAYDNEIIQMGGKVFHAPRLYPQNYKKYIKFMKNFFYEHEEYKIVHSHIDTMSSFPLYCAKKAGIPIRIAHSHNTKFDFDYKLLIKFLSRLYIKKESNIFFACGNAAGKFLYGSDDFFVLNNAIDVKKFSFSPEKRKEKRKELGIGDNTIVIGHVGRFVKQKNHVKLINVFNKYIKFNNKSILLLVGDGPDKEKIIKMVKKYNLEEKVRFLGLREDVSELYSAFDLFLLPSKFEGLPVVGIEAQCVGLPCIFSNTISEEVMITNNVKMIDLSKKDFEWAKDISSISVIKNSHAETEIINSGYDILNESKKLEEIYLKLNEKAEK